MTLQEIKESKKDVLTPEDIAELFRFGTLEEEER